MIRVHYIECAGFEKKTKWPTKASSHKYQKYTIYMRISKVMSPLGIYYGLSLYLLCVMIWMTVWHCGQPTSTWPFWQYALTLQGYITGQLYDCDDNMNAIKSTISTQNIGKFDGPYCLFGCFLLSIASYWFISNDKHIMNCVDKHMLI